MNRFKKLFFENKKIRKVIGAVLILVGLTALVTPLTPGSWLIFIGLELLGVRFLWWDKIKQQLRRPGRTS